jgi:hypothetical protein
LAGAAAITQPTKGATTGALNTSATQPSPARGQLARPLPNIGPLAAAQPTAGALADTLAAAGALTTTDPLANPGALPSAEPLSPARSLTGARDLRPIHSAAWNLHVAPADRVGGQIARPTRRADGTTGPAGTANTAGIAGTPRTGPDLATVDVVDVAVHRAVDVDVAATPIGVGPAPQPGGNRHPGGKR